MGSGAAPKLFISDTSLCFPLFLLMSVCIWSCFHGVQCQSHLPLPKHEVVALRRIFQKLGQKWNFSADPCTVIIRVKSTSDNNVESNVTCGACNRRYCHVTMFAMRSLNLTGSLPDEFASLKHLQVIALTRNYLNGTIPAAWASLPLTKLSLMGNRISGRIPEELGNMTTVVELVLQDNLLEGPIPPSLGKLINLKIFHLSGNNFSGELPKALGNLKNLTELMVSSLKGGNGEFPPLHNSRQLKTLVLRNLSISGVLPDYLGNMANLELLDLSFNNLTGQIPGSFSNLSNLGNMFLTNNKLTGEIPKWIFTRGQHYDLSYNNFNGSDAPKDYCQIGYVNLVSSYSSTDSNTIASCLRRNNPCPVKPKHHNLFINCGGASLTIGEDEYEGDENIGGASDYHSYDEKWAYSSTGRFVHNVDNEPFIATNLSVLNMLNPELYMTARLSPASLKYYGLCLQNGNYTVKLHFAEIMITADEAYYNVGRRFFDVSIQGEKVLSDFNIAKEANGTGKAIVKTFDAQVSENTLEIHFQWTGQGTSFIPHKSVYGPLISAISVTPNFKPDTDESKLSTGAILGIVAAGCVVIALISTFIWFHQRRKDTENKGAHVDLQGLELQTGYLTLSQIRAATGNFNPENKIGEGGFGPVYKGVLSDGTVIAVKQLSAKSRQGNREFINEIGMISALQHPNLVKLFGCCVERNQLLLIYEYMENNSLANALFGLKNNQLKLDWQTRRRICLGIARGLAYMHEESMLKIVHRDIKATNILLDEDFNAKISDFGLAKLFETDESHVSTRIAGTIGYMAPEYAMRGHLTDKADAYSFGIVVLEIVSGISNANCKQMDFVHLVDWAYVLQEQGDLLGLVDNNLGPNYCEKEALQMLNLALMCTNPSPSLRPKMSTVVSILDGKNYMPVPSIITTDLSGDETVLKASARPSDEVSEN
ncbi:Non-specific serine/threonine protein kinase protein [Dioscorea alata]|uniref:Non-specific serine/threonine protein kinase protein n=1 Tax=Dioscorea alata TaxID=55571 RepID=A0ACB7UXL3_DIOAL|nr:Non-specific serine/threonine protein kinase protein [Dioscorea alata]